VWWRDTWPNSTWRKTPEDPGSAVSIQRTQTGWYRANRRQSPGIGWTGGAESQSLYKFTVRSVPFAFYSLVFPWRDSTLGLLSLAQRYLHRFLGSIPLQIPLDPTRSGCRILKYPDMRPCQPRKSRTLGTRLIGPRREHRVRHL
jgi:hypothetical protein